MSIGARVKTSKLKIFFLQYFITYAKILDLAIAKLEILTNLKTKFN